MIAYIIKFILCSGFLYSFYKLFLERESMYKINRFYLLSSLVFSLIAPLYKIQLPITEAESQISPELLAYLLANPQLLEVEKGINYGEIINWIYLLLGLGLLLKFSFNLYALKKRINEDEKFEDDDITFVLDKKSDQPFSFLKYIFIPKSNYQNIHPNLIQHEKAHCIQLHSWDILFIEAFQILFWFNPFVYLYKKSIKLNHEFLADEYVLQNEVDIKTYQHQILDCIATQSQHSVASHFNFILTKKRLLMMTKNTSKQKVRFLTFASFPFILSAFVLFSEKSFAQEVEKNAKKVEKALEQTIENSIKDALSFSINDNDTIRKVGALKMDSQTVEIELINGDSIKLINKRDLNKIKASDIKAVEIDKKSDIITFVKKNNDTIKYNFQSIYIPTFSIDENNKIDQLKTNELLSEKAKNKLKEIYPSGIKSFEIYKKDEKKYIKVDGKEYLFTDDLNVLKELSKTDLEKLNKAKDLLNNKKINIENIKVKIDTLKQPSPWNITVEPHNFNDITKVLNVKSTNKIEMVDGQSIYYDKNGVKHNILNSEVKLDKTPLVGNPQLQSNLQKDSKSLKVKSMYIPDNK